MEMTKERALQIVESRGVVKEVGYQFAKVTNLNYYEEGEKTIISLSLTTTYQREKAKQLILDGWKAEKAGNFELSNQLYQEATNHVLTVNARKGTNDYLPHQGEIVKAFITTVKNKQDVEILVVQSIVELKAKAAEKVKLEINFDEEPAVTNATLSTNQDSLDQPQISEAGKTELENTLAEL